MLGIKKLIPFFIGSTFANSKLKESSCAQSMTSLRVDSLPYFADHDLSDRSSSKKATYLKQTALPCMYSGNMLSSFVH